MTKSKRIYDDSNMRNVRIVLLSILFNATFDVNRIKAIFEKMVYCTLRIVSTSARNIYNVGNICICLLDEALNILIRHVLELIIWQVN
jgi:hypothetical protein